MPAFDDEGARSPNSIARRAGLRTAGRLRSRHRRQIRSDPEYRPAGWRHGGAIPPALGNTRTKRERAPLRLARQPDGHRPEPPPVLAGGVHRAAADSALEHGALDHYADGARNRPPRRAEIETGVSLLPGFVALLPRLRVVVMAGRTAVLAMPVLRKVRRSGASRNAASEPDLRQHVAGNCRAHFAGSRRGPGSPLAATGSVIRGESRRLNLPSARTPIIVPLINPTPTHGASGMMDRPSP